MYYSILPKKKKKEKHEYVKSITEVGEIISSQTF